MHPAGAKESILSAKLRANEKEIERKPIPKQKLRNNWRNAFELLEKKKIVNPNKIPKTSFISDFGIFLVDIAAAVVAAAFLLWNLL